MFTVGIPALRLKINHKLSTVKKTLPLLLAGAIIVMVIFCTSNSVGI